VESVSAGEKLIQVFDAVGMKVLEKKSIGKYEILEIGSISRGIYYVRVNHELGSETQMLIVN
jgi:hypothetical protein